MEKHEKKAPGRCVFCKRSGDLSKEHIWSDWMAEFFPKQAMPAHYEVLSVHTMKTVPVSQKTMARQGGAITKKLRVVCRACNHGWMKAVEEAARPILTRLIVGEPTVLDCDQQRTLAEWIALKMMVAEHSVPAEVIVPQADRDRFFGDRTIPPYFHIWVISSDSEKWRSRYVRHNATFTRPTGSPPSASRNTQSIAWGIGKLFIYVMMTTTEDLDLTKFINVHRLVPKLYPYSSTTLPLPFLWNINDAAGDKMAGSLDELIQSPHVIYKEQPKGTQNG